jgi:hypothetical protein
MKGKVVKTILNTVENQLILYYPINNQSMYKLFTLIKLSYLAENRGFKKVKQNSFELLDMMIVFIKFLQNNFEEVLPTIGVNFLIETLKLMRFEVINDERQVMLTSLLNFLEAYINHFVQTNYMSFSKHIVGLEAFVIFEIIDTSKHFLQEWCFN